MQTANDAATNSRAKQLRTLLRDKINQQAGSLRRKFVMMTCDSINGKLSRSAFARFVKELMNFDNSSNDTRSRTVSQTTKDEEMMVSMVFDGCADKHDSITYNQFHNFVQNV
uniref:Uncharacterized protein n=1 Tax=Lygus hesperus TaxID=30085 RepID=A0A146KWE4_LYGHE